MGGEEEDAGIPQGVRVVNKRTPLFHIETQPCLERLPAHCLRSWADPLMEVRVVLVRFRALPVHHERLIVMLSERLCSKGAVKHVGRHAFPVEFNVRADHARAPAEVRCIRAAEHEIFKLGVGVVDNDPPTELPRGGDDFPADDERLL